MGALSIRVGDRVIDLSSPIVMGILNTTPDSFSDGGQLRAGEHDSAFRVSVDKALQKAAAMLGEGASIIDVGGESTRPGALPVSEQEEIDRVLPVVEALRQRLDVAVSVDTSRAGVMRAAIAAGAGLVNDVRALAQAGTAALLAPRRDVSICLMHMRGQPETMQEQVAYEDVVAEVKAFLQQRIQYCLDAGIERERLIVDPGFGFGKTVAHNYQLLRELACFEGLGLPVLVGVSRKSMLGAVTDRAPAQRLAAGIAATTYALWHGAAIVRTHDVAETVDAIRVYEALSGVHGSKGCENESKK